MSSLNEKQILARSRAKRLPEVTKLNLWGSKLVDISLLQQVPNLQVLTLSSNNVGTLRHLTACTQLTELYIRKNSIESLDELQYLRGLLCLRVLWLADNPCTQDENYRLRTIASLPQLQRLDNVDIEDEERKEAAAAYSSRFLGTQSVSQMTEPTQNMFSASITASNNLLTAALCLLQELDPSSLQTIARAAQDQLNKTMARTTVTDSPVRQNVDTPSTRQEETA